MQSFGAFPNAVEESSLWQILEDNVPDKYYLSEKACQGVLRRAGNRGKDLHILLHIALLQGCGMPVEMAEIGKDLCPTITAAAGMSGNNQPVFCYALDRSSFNSGQNAQFDIGIDDSGIAHTLVAKGPGAVAYGVEIGDRIVLEVRRATPTECGRLQGMPDWWCEDVPHSDTAEYKMWGNGMALPNVLYVMEGVVSLLSVRLLNSILEVSG